MQPTISGWIEDLTAAMNRYVKALIAGLLLAAAGASFFSLPSTQEIEEEYGLALLFSLRGSRTPPENAVIVNIDSDSSLVPGIPAEFNKWPRSVHARLVDHLTRYGASVIAFDVLFADEKDKILDIAFAEAVRRAGNVILVQDIQHKSVDASSGSDVPATAEIDYLVSPYVQLASSALGLAPFPLPKVPVRVTKTWRFKESSGAIPTLPVAVFQAWRLDALNRLIAIMREMNPGYPGLPLPLSGQAQYGTDSNLTETMREVRTIFRQEPRLKEKLLEYLEKDKNAFASGSKEKAIIRTLISLYGGENSAAIDFYGPPFTIPTLSFQDILAGEEEQEKPLSDLIKNKVVFVGAVNNSWSSQKDGFYTVFSRSDGLDISGVELAATVFSNLSEDRYVKYPPLPVSLGIIILTGLFGCLISLLNTPLRASLILLALSLLFTGGAYLLFASNGIALPIVTPLIIILPVSFITGALINYFDARKEHQQIRTALRYYVPDRVVEGLSRDLSFISKGDQRTYSTCLMTDAQNYTTLSESLTPEELSNHMKEYYQCLFGEVKKQGGTVCNIIGDAMLVHWPSARPDEQESEKACQAALDITASVESFNLQHKRRQLPTRIGLNAGYLIMDNIGAEDHYEYAPVGDIVNTVSRIEGLNKILGTKILASEEVIRNVRNISIRGVGLFLLSGKTHPTQIFELLPIELYSAEKVRLLQDAFPEALKLFQSGNWRKALRAFDHCLARNTEDGPSRFYRRLCKSYLNAPPQDWQGIVNIGK